MQDDDGEVVRRKGYRYMMARLFQAQQTCGRAAVMALLKGHGASCARDVKPALYEQIAIFAEGMIMNVRCWDDMKQGLPPKPRHGVARYSTPRFRQTADQWLDACEIALRFTVPQFFMDSGAPIHTPNCKNG